MNACLLSAHNDDCELWASFLTCRHNPYVIVCLRSQVEEDRGTGITAATREYETNLALSELEITAWEQWPYLDSQPNWVEIEQGIVELATRFDHCFAPAVEPGGHEQHNKIGGFALAAFGAERTTQYTTYTRHAGRSYGIEVVPEPWMIAAKHRALACYQSQIEYEATRPWFLGDLREWIA